MVDGGLEMGAYGADGGGRRDPETPPGCEALAMRLAVMDIFATATERDTMIPAVLDAIRHATQCSAVTYWELRAQRPTLVAGTGALDVEQRQADARLPPVGLCATIDWCAVDDDAAAHVRTLVRVPVRKQGEVVGVLELCDAQKRDHNPRLAAALGPLGDTMGATLARIDAAHASESARRAAEATLELKSAFLANMSHEIRTQIHGVLGLLSMMLDSPLAEQPRQYAETAHDAGGALLALLNDVLDLSKIEAGRLEVERIAFTPSQVVDDVVNVFQHIAQHKQLALEVHVAPSATHSVLGDPTRLRQILFNVVGNAVKFTPSGRVTIFADGIAPDQLRVRVCDSGIGIAPEVLPHLFRSFTQSDASVSRRFGGTGMGLAIAQHLARLLGGTISVESTQGVGSTFELVVPAPTAAVAPAAEAEEPTEAPLPKLRVIVVDDQRVNLLIASGILQRLGQTVTTVSSGEEALERLKHEEFDLVLMDCLMPGLDGYDTSRALRALGFTRPIVAFTARERQFEAFAFREAGMDDIITKPATQRDMANVIRRHAT